MKYSPQRLHYRAKSALGVVGWCGLALIVGAGPARAARRPGAPRPLRLLWPEDKGPGAILLAGANASSAFDGVFAPRVASDSRPHSEGPNSWALFFTRQADGTRNICRADPQLTTITKRNDLSNKRSDGSEELRNLAWQVTPLTHLAAPLFAEQPAVSPDGRTLLCATNAFGGVIPSTNQSVNGRNNPPRSQIARLDLQSGRWTTLTSNDARDHSPVIAPNGQQFAFVSNRSGLESIYVMPIEGGNARRVATMGRNPCWLDDGTLLFESTRPGQLGLYHLNLPRDGAGVSWDTRPRLFFDRTGEVALAPDGHQLCITADPGPKMTRRSLGDFNADKDANRTALPRQLYLLAPDGSGARAIPGTEGARAPHFTPDGSAIVFDAPVDGGATAANGVSATDGSSRALWLLPMLRVPPTAVLMSVRPALVPGQIALSGATADEVEVIGTAFAEGVGVPEVKLEYGEGTAPTHWHNLPVQRATVQEGKLATWKLPPGAQGDWTLRLTVTDSSNDQSQATFPLSLPITLPAQLAQGGSAPTVAPLTSGPAVTGGNTHPSPTVAPTATPLPHLASSQGVRPLAGANAAPNPLTTDIRPKVMGMPVTVPGYSAPAAPHKTKSSKHNQGASAGLNSNPPRLAGPVQVLPLPALPPAPTPHPIGPGSTPKGNTSTGNSSTGTPSNPPSGNNPPSNSLPTFPQDATFPNGPPFTTEGGPLPPPKPKPKLRRRPRPAKTIRKTKPPRNRPNPDELASNSSNSKAQPVATANEDTGSGEDDAKLTVEGTPGTMQAGENVNVTATLRNVGTRAWATESAQPVRLVYRWVDAATGIRTRWAVRWLQSSVAPGGSTQLAVTLTAPPRPGRYKLTYVMVRINGDKFELPPATTPTSHWPGEFGGTTYRVTVRASEHPALPRDSKPD